MDQELQLFRLLSDGEFHSGQVIASKLSVSRSRVWALMNVLQDKGVVVSRVRGKGYKYRGGSSLLDSGRIQASFPTMPLYYSPTMTSTNDVAREHCNSNNVPLLVTTEFQTGGRGRRGRSWLGSYAHNLMFSIAIPEFSATKGLDGLSLVVGMTLAKVLLKSYDVDVQLKWPNDLLVKDAKLGGVLIEIQGDIAGQYSLIIGAGLNVNVSPEIVGRDATSISCINLKPIDRTDLLIVLVSELKAALLKFCENGFSAFVGQWNEMDAYLNRDVRVDMAGRDLFGISKGVNASGALVIDTGKDLVEVHGGEVSLRLI